MNFICRWDHSKDFYVFQHTDQKIVDRKEMTVNINAGDEEFMYLAGHVINEKNLLPATGYLFFLWERLASLKNQEYINVPIVFEDINFVRATVLSQHNEIELTLLIQKGNVII